MKKIALLLFMMSLSLGAVEIKPDGVGINLNYNSTSYVDTADSTTESASLIEGTISPTLHYILEDKSTEFAPYLSFGCIWESNPDGISHGSLDIGDEMYRLKIGGGASILWHFFEGENDKIDLVTGFRGDVNYSFAKMGENAPTGDAGDPQTTDFNISVYVPLSIDFKLTPKFTLRVNSDIINVGYSLENEVDEDTSYKTGIFDSTFPLLDDGTTAISISAIYYMGK